MCLFLHSTPLYPLPESTDLHVHSLSAFLTPTALLRQTNPNWKVFLLMTQSDRKFEGRVRNILEQYGDLRVTLLNGYAPVSSNLAACFSTDRGICVC
jgi:hypothetical protein